MPEFTYFAIGGPTASFGGSLWGLNLEEWSVIAQFTVAAAACAAAIVAVWASRAAQRQADREIKLDALRTMIDLIEPLLGERVNWLAPRGAIRGFLAMFDESKLPNMRRAVEGDGIIGPDGEVAKSPNMQRQVLLRELTDEIATMARKR